MFSSVVIGESVRELDSTLVPAMHLGVVASPG